MKYSHIELIPSVLKPQRPSQFDGESFTVLEYVSKLSPKMTECIEEYNKFVDEVVKYCNEFTAGATVDNDAFKSDIMQKLKDFMCVLEERFKGQDKEIDEAVDYMKDNLANSIETVILTSVESGILDTAILNAVGNLNTRFDSTVQSVATHIDTSNANYNSFVQEVNTALNDMNGEIEDGLSEIDGAIAETTAAVEAVNTAVAAINVAILEIDGGTPFNDTDETDYDGGNV